MPGHGKGGPPSGQEFRCQALTRRGPQCNCYRKKDRLYCQFHGGNRKQVSTRNMGIYSKHLGETLSRQLDQLLGEPVHEQIALYEELALARIQALDAAKLYELSLGPRVTAETKAMAAGVLSEAMSKVRDMAMAISRIERETEDKVSVRVIGMIVNQVVRAVQSVTGENAELFAQLEEAIRKTVRLPTRSALTIGDSALAPGATAAEMDKVTAPGEGDPTDDSTDSG